MLDTYGMDDINTQAIRELTTEVDALKRKVNKGGDSDLPEPTIADAGKVLGVNDQGKYALVEGGESNSNLIPLHIGGQVVNRLSNISDADIIASHEPYILTLITQVTSQGMTVDTYFRGAPDRTAYIMSKIPLKTVSSMLNRDIYDDDGHLIDITNNEELVDVCLLDSSNTEPFASYMPFQSTPLILSGTYKGYVGQVSSS